MQDGRTPAASSPLPVQEPGRILEYKALSRRSDTSHVPFVSKPAAVIELIEEAATATLQATAGLQR